MSWQGSATACCSSTSTRPGKCCAGAAVVLQRVLRDDAQCYFSTMQRLGWLLGGTLGRLPACLRPALPSDPSRPLASRLCAPLPPSPACSEHTIDGRWLAMEAHLVHKNLETGNLAVLGEGGAKRCGLCYAVLRCSVHHLGAASSVSLLAPLLLASSPLPACPPTPHLPQASSSRRATAGCPTL